MSSVLLQRGSVATEFVAGPHVSSTVWVGVDVGSTTVKVAVVDPETRSLLFSRYLRHNAKQGETALALLEEVHAQYPRSRARVAFCGSAGAPFAKETGAFFVQEVVANTLYIREFHPGVKVSIELGGQDAKVVFFENDPATGKPMAAEMRMNGSCAGGTGAFVDQVAELLHCRAEEFEALAASGTKVYEVSGRCGVFAKTDIQPLLNQGVNRSDIALSTFHAIAKQTIGGLAQGLEIRPPVIFEGGPLTYNPRLVEVFRERLNLAEEDAVVPENAHILVAWGAALATADLFGEEECLYRADLALDALRNFRHSADPAADRLADPFFHSPQEFDAFEERHTPKPVAPYEVAAGTTLPVILGVDAGSTTTKFVLLDLQGKRVDSFYASNQGDPLQVFQQAMIGLRSRWEARGVNLVVACCGTTGYGEGLFAKALHADIHTVETVAHARAARELHPEASFILDIGGQDMKAIFLRGGVVSGIVLNEACSAGCGSFIETYARSLGVPLEMVAPMAFRSNAPSHLGSRCTVFMNSSIITEQRDGKSPEDILAGLCRSVIENVFTKVVRLRSTTELGKTVIVQGGTFHNDAVLRAFEQYSGITPIRPPHPGEMGAQGIALLALEHLQARLTVNPLWTSSFPGWSHVESLSWEKLPGQVCTFCPNSCNRTVVSFSHGASHVTGNRCEKGELLGDSKDPETKADLVRIAERIRAVPDMLTRQVKALTHDFVPAATSLATRGTIGLPRVLEFWGSLPFWRTFLMHLGYKVVVSRASDYKLFEDGLSAVPSDTVCFPAKLVHGHVRELVRRKVDRILFPSMLSMPSEHRHHNATAVCPVIQGYPTVSKVADDPESKGVPMDTPAFHWDTDGMRGTQVERWFRENWGLGRKELRRAIVAGENALQAWRESLQEEGRRILEALPPDGFAMVVGGRPYHSDPLVNHHLSSHFVAMGIPVLTLESLPGVYEQDMASLTRLELYNTYHTRLLAAAMIAARDPRLELVQIVSFGCGHDATLSDELSRLMLEHGDKEPLVLKLDEGDVRGPVAIRIKSFVETVKSRRLRKAGTVCQPAGVAASAPKGPLLGLPFTHEDKAKRTILIPNLSPPFSLLAASLFREQGFLTRALPVGDKRAFELGKKFVHNDICFPAQVNVGEFLRHMEQETCDHDSVALVVGKNCVNCRAGQYSALARKALDEAGFDDIPIVTTGEDTKGQHPGFFANSRFRIGIVRGMSIIDRMEAMVRMVRPYELEAGTCDRVFEHHLQRIVDLVPNDHKAALKAFAKAVNDFNAIPADRSVRRPRVGVLGEILIKFHPAANGHVERYLERNGLEVSSPGMLDFFRRDEMVQLERVRRGQHHKPIMASLISGISEFVYRDAVGKAERIYKQFRWYTPMPDCWELAREIDGMMDRTYLVGEGWMIPAEILHLGKHGVNSFVVMQPFGCLANHISGRGMLKAIKRKLPMVQVLPLDFDPDTSLANVENRLQMLVINARSLEKSAIAQLSA